MATKSKDNYNNNRFDLMLAIFIITSILFTNITTQGFSSRQLEMSPVEQTKEQAKAVSVALFPATPNTAVGKTNIVSLKVAQTNANSPVAIRGLMFRIRVSDPGNLSLEPSTITWGDKFSNISGVKYATYNQSTGNLDVAIANNADIILDPNETILSFGIRAKKQGNYNISFDKQFEGLDIVNAKSEKILDTYSLEPLSITADETKISPKTWWTEIVNFFRSIFV